MTNRRVNIANRCINFFSGKSNQSHRNNNNTNQINNSHEIVYSSVEKKILQFVNSANELLEQMVSHDALKYVNIQKINIPRIVLTGTQSSGKSTIVNRFIGMDILPIGDNMITRTPVNIRLTTADRLDDCYARISVYKDGSKEIVYSTMMENINIAEFQNRIMDATNRVTDNRYSISSSQIFVDINSMQVENMTIIDLPGIVSISCTDKGQPPTIVDDIKRLIIEQLEYPETYVLVVVSSLVDLEADSGLATIKLVQKENTKLRAVGVLTKPDGLRSVSKLQNIINNDEYMSKDLMLNDGYFVVNNLIPDNSEWYTKTFGLSSSVMRKKRYGILNLKSHLKKTLMTMIKDKLPNIHNNLQLIQREINLITPKLEDNLDQTTAKILFITNMTYIMSKCITDSITSTSIHKNIGNPVNSAFRNFHVETNKLDPFSKILFTDDELDEIINNFNGYIPGANNKDYLTVVRCLTDENKKPIKLILPYVEKCIGSLIQAIVDEVSRLLMSKKLDYYPCNLNKYNIGLNNFPKLRNFIFESTIELLEIYRYNVTESVNHILSVHEKHLMWFNQESFKEPIDNNEYDDSNVLGENIIDIENDDSDNVAIKLKHDPENSNAGRPTISKMRNLLRCYFKKIIKMCQVDVCKMLASDILKQFEHNFFIEINAKFSLLSEEKINELFYETDDMIKNKKVYDGMVKTIEQLLKQSNELIK